MQFWLFRNYVTFMWSKNLLIHTFNLTSTIIHLFFLSRSRFLFLSLFLSSRCIAVVDRQAKEHHSPSETFAIARCIPMHLGNTELCPRNTNCSDDLCVIRDRDDSAGSSFVMCCIVPVFLAANDFTRSARIAIRSSIIKRESQEYQMSSNVPDVINCAARLRSTSMSRYDRYDGRIFVNRRNTKNKIAL